MIVAYETSNIAKSVSSELITRDLRADFEVEVSGQLIINFETLGFEKASPQHMRGNDMPNDEHHLQRRMEAMNFAPKSPQRSISFPIDGKEVSNTSNLPSAFRLIKSHTFDNVTQRLPDSGRSTESRTINPMSNLSFDLQMPKWVKQGWNELVASTEIPKCNDVAEAVARTPTVLPRRRPRWSDFDTQTINVSSNPFEVPLTPVDSPSADADNVQKNFNQYTTRPDLSLQRPENHDVPKVNRTEQHSAPPPSSSIDTVPAKIAALWEKHSTPFSRSQSQPMPFTEKIVPQTASMVTPVRFAMSMSSNDCYSPISPTDDVSHRTTFIPSSTPNDRLSSFFPEESNECKVYMDSEILEIAALLALVDETWSKMPRTYTLLRRIGQLNHIQAFIDHGFSDHWFPVTMSSLPKNLPQDLRTQVLNSQEIILTKSIDLEKGELGRHLHFAKREAIPFESKGILGTGGFGQVDRVLSLISYKEYARKLIPRRAAFSSRPSTVIQAFVAEIQILKSLKHKHIVRFVGSYTDPKYLCLIMSPIAQMDLGEYLASCKQENMAELRTFFGCLTRALEFLHQRAIRHKDIKPGNILVHNGNVLLTDFGLARDFADGSAGGTTSGLTALSPRYCAPEVSSYDARNASSDIWSLGCVFFEMVAVLKGLALDRMKAFFLQHGTGHPFIRTNMEAFLHLATDLERFGSVKDNRPLSWTRDMLQLERAQRPTATDVLEMILAPDVYGEYDMSFVGLCCQEDEESDVSDYDEEQDEGFAER